MRILIHTLFYIFIASVGYSQIPNPGFEDWTVMGTYSNPTSWGTMNNNTASSAIFTATKGAPGNPGASYLKLTSKTIGGNVVNGIAVSGVLDSITKLPKSGFPFTQRPQSLTGKWQHMIYGTSQGAVSALLTKWNSALGVRDTVAAIAFNLSGMQMSWQNFSIDLVYHSGEYPDSCIIFLQASGPVPAANDYLWVDDLAFVGSVAGLTEMSLPKITVTSFPNPADNSIEFRSSLPLQKSDKVIVYDLPGNEIAQINANESAVVLNTSNFPNGIYIFKVIDTYNVPYFTGKFTVQH